MIDILADAENCPENMDSNKFPAIEPTTLHNLEKYIEIEPEFIYHLERGRTNQVGAGTPVNSLASFEKIKTHEGRLSSVDGESISLSVERKPFYAKDSGKIIPNFADFSGERKSLSLPAVAAEVERNVCVRSSTIENMKKNIDPEPRTVTTDGGFPFRIPEETVEDLKREETVSAHKSKSKPTEKLMRKSKSNAKRT